MKITWSSRKGMARKLNSDAAALAYVGDYLIAVVVDVAEKPCGNRWLFGMSPEGKCMVGRSLHPGSAHPLFQCGTGFNFGISSGSRFWHGHSPERPDLDVISKSTGSGLG